ncbi:hypothetical protein P9597_07525, partial [Aneurinibacillus migulanus]|uniref:hypothetical protein n=1 Tax=Aneurinibacillus migulanus TaxID=47500 RepID=UPI002E1F6249|nr:hypothetical protein [Aneurinibacillus migulanus]
LFVSFKGKTESGHSARYPRTLKRGNLISEKSGNLKTALTVSPCLYLLLKMYSIVLMFIRLTCF